MRGFFSLFISLIDHNSYGDTSVKPTKFPPSVMSGFGKFHPFYIYVFAFIFIYINIYNFLLSLFKIYCKGIGWVVWL